jgi:DNA (cytosine-5)-methyltransferase 1
MNELALFAGAGGGILGGKLLGWRTICAVEWEPYPASVLCARQNDGLLSTFPIWDDVQTFDGHPWRGIVDVVSGGFPCQDISAAGKGAGIDGERSGMWGEMARIIREVRPKYVFVENSPMLTSRGLSRVFGDLAAMGFDARWGVLGAADVGANHQRDRIWIIARQRERISHAEYNGTGRGEQQQESPTQAVGTVANPQCKGLEGQSDSREQEVSWTGSGGTLANPTHSRDVWREWELGFAKQEHHSGGSPIDGIRQWWSVEPSVGRVAHGVAARVDRLKAIGNGQVPLCAATAWRVLTRDWIV